MKEPPVVAVRTSEVVEPWTTLADAEAAVSASAGG